MHGSEHRTPGDDMPVPAPNDPGDNVRRRNRRAGWTACALSAAAAAAVVSAVALTGGSANGEAALPPTAPVAATPLAGTNGTETIAPCTTEALAVSSQKEPADAAETRHLLITVQNAGSTTCEVYRYPYILLGNGQAPAPVIEESDPDPGVPVTLAPGGEAYAAMVLNGPMDEYEVNSISLTLQGSAPGSTAGGPIDVPMPGATPLYANDFQRVTYWTTAPGYALDFVMSK